MKTFAQELEVIQNRIKLGRESYISPSFKLIKRDKYKDYIMGDTKSIITVMWFNKNKGYLETKLYVGSVLPNREFNAYDTNNHLLLSNKTVLLSYSRHNKIQKVDSEFFNK